MPYYSYKCTCGEKAEAFRKIPERHDSPRCSRCREKMSIVPSLPAVHLWKPLQLELEPNVVKTFEKKKDLKQECERLGKSMPGLDINM